MKYLLVLIATLAMIFSSCQKENLYLDDSKLELSQSYKGFPDIVFKFGTKSHPGGDDCECCVGDKGVCIIFKVKPASTLALQQGEGLANFKINSSNQIEIGILDDYYADSTSTSLVVVDTVDFTAAAADSLGYTSISIHPGNYSVDYSDSAYTFGKAIMDATIIP